MHLHLTESSAVPGMQTTAEAERAYWLNREQAAVKAPAEIDVHAFHDALGLMYPMNWRSSENGECETFMLAEMICGNVTEIYARIGKVLNALDSRCPNWDLWEECRSTDKLR